MRKIKSVIALATCVLTTLSVCSMGVKAEGYAESSDNSMPQIIGGADMASEEKTIYDDMDLSIFDLPRYDNAKYLQYYWDSNITYNESAMIVRNADGTLDKVKLLFNVDKIISVRSADLQTKYEEGIDYEIQDGKLVILEDGKIPILNYDRMYFETNPGEAGSGNTVEGNENVEAFPTVDGKYEIYEEAGILYQHQIAVTYYHKDKGNYTIPMGQSREFAGLIGKLERRESVNIVCLGDSISNGSSASGFFANKLMPAMPSYFGLVGDYVKAKYGYQKVYLYEDPTHYVADKENEPTRIKMTNFSVGGKDSYWGLTQAEAVAAKNPDLVILGFGMNDGSAYTGEKAYYENMLSIITTIKKNNPNCEFVVLGTMLPNAKICWNVGGVSIYGNQEKYLPKLQKLAQEEAGVALADITTLHKEYLTVKNYRDMTGNNVNHPNDFLMRLYAQTIVKTIFG
jgi:lysophospholipase L1-like esterase